MRRRREVTLERALDTARSGDQQGFNEVYALLGGRVLAFLRSRSAWDPEGLTNEVFLAAFSGLDDFDGDADAFRGWVFTIARNKAIDDARRRASRPPAASDAASADTGVGDVEEDVFGRLEREWIEEMLGDLTHEQREVIVLRLVDDLSVRDVSRIVGRPEAAVRALQRRGLVQLQKKFHADPSHDGDEVR